MGKVFIVGGLVMAGIGLLMLAGIPFGRLPGDFVIRRGNASFYFPLATSVVISILLTLLFALLRR